MKYHYTSYINPELNRHFYCSNPKFSWCFKWNPPKNPMELAKRWRTEVTCPAGMWVTGTYLGVVLAPQKMAGWIVEPRQNSAEKSGKSPWKLVIPPSKKWWKSWWTITIQNGMILDEFWGYHWNDQPFFWWASHVFNGFQGLNMDLTMDLTFWKMVEEMVYKWLRIFLGKVFCWDSTSKSKQSDYCCRL